MLELLWYLAEEDLGAGEHPQERSHRLLLCERAGFVTVSGNHLGPEARRILVTKCDGIILAGSDVGTEARELFFAVRKTKHVVNVIGLDDEMFTEQLGLWKREYDRAAIRNALATVVSKSANPSSRD